MPAPERNGWDKDKDRNLDVGVDFKKLYSR